MFKQRFTLFLCLLIATLFLGEVRAGEKQKLRLFLQESLDSEGRQLALDPKVFEILAYFERRTGLQFEHIILPWKRAQAETLVGNGIIYGFSKSSERLRYYQFSQPVMVERVWGITYGKPVPQYKTVEDLRGKIVSTGRGFSHGLEFDQARDVVFKVQEDSASTISRFKKLMAKRSDLMVWPVRGFENHKDVENYFNHFILEQANDPDLKGKHFNVTEKPLFLDSLHFASAKGHYADAIAKIDKAIVQGNKDGSLPQVLRGYH
ncbi:substrate-binding periplasmic protein [Undibacterium fentianense]|uniref:Transporter substrate-binding domain-containing protein n=1 Tax=Undibacterium fentianense TaxID=2828728 RepID=A0A941E487_9BURK|nr:transporter substrate-binding domain-containing protein [Undibacterium fentianense]MBR7801231.1 transporter substrate-binding domain-containing protein [Undibacterium fentianense]